MIKEKQNKVTDDRPIVHLVCQAHIDPVWMWTWQEGAREAISTFHTAADMLDEFPEFVFNHNESVLYEFIEDNDSELFERIRKLVKQERWHVAGGWYLQPDLNMSAGETIVQLIQEGRRYFDSRFGVKPTVAYNFDTFGHPASLPQILAQAGYGLYLHCRPVPPPVGIARAALSMAGSRWRARAGSAPRHWLVLHWPGGYSGSRRADGQSAGHEWRRASARDGA